MNGIVCSYRKKEERSQKKKDMVEANEERCMLIDWYEKQ